jgi:hypothetical protein
MASVTAMQGSSPNTTPHQPGVRASLHYGIYNPSLGRQYPSSFLPGRRCRHLRRPAWMCQLPCCFRRPCWLWQRTVVVHSRITVPSPVITGNGIVVLYKSAGADMPIALPLRTGLCIAQHQACQRPCRTVVLAVIALESPIHMLASSPQLRWLLSIAMPLVIRYRHRADTFLGTALASSPASRWLLANVTLA